MNTTDPYGEFGLAGFAIGAGRDLGIQLYVNGGDFSKVNYASVAISGAAGATGVGLSGVVSKRVAQIGLTGAKAVLARATLNAAGSAAIGAGAQAANNIANGEPVSQNIGAAAATSAALGGAGSVAGDATAAGVKGVQAAQSDKPFRR